MVQKVLGVNFFFINVFVPLVGLIVYFVSFEFLFTPLLEIPIGVNYYFAARSWRYLSYILLGCILIFFVIATRNKREKFQLKKSIDMLSVYDIILLLLPIMPIVQYIINNQNILSPIGSLYVFFFFVLFSCIFVFILPALLGFIGSSRILMLIGLAYTFTLLSMVSFSKSFAWFTYGSLWIQWMIFGTVFLIILFFDGLNDKRILRTLVAVLFVSNSAVHWISYYHATHTASLSNVENKLLSLVEEREPVITPNIYLLIYDAYAPSETMLSFGIDNGAQEEFLKDRGFILYPHTYSIGPSTFETMSRVLNASTDLYGNPRRATSGDGVVQKIFKDFGYTTYGIFGTNFFYRGIDPTWDVFSPSQSSSVELLWRAILMGEFRFDAGVINKQTDAQYADVKQAIFNNPPEGPIFLYSHSMLPAHSQNSGKCLTDENERYGRRVQRANEEMREDINAIVNNDPQAIIVVAGDHGPHLTGNCINREKEYDPSEISRVDLQDRFGTFLAIRWPTEDYDKFDAITVLQDIFPSILAYLLNDERILEAKIEPSTLSTIAIVKNGIIYGGVNDGEPLFISDK